MILIGQYDSPFVRRVGAPPPVFRIVAQKFITPIGPAVAA